MKGDLLLAGSALRAAFKGEDTEEAHLGSLLIAEAIFRLIGRKPGA